jgi:serine/threonine-protein kinase
VLHRDLKPENVMLDGQGRVRLMDFGLAAVREDVKPDDLHSGTPAYMAPEQLDGREVTVRSDIYALGLVLHEMFTGRQIFDAPTLADLRRQRQSFTPERASLTSSDADPAVEQVIRRCLETDPEDRPASALAVAMALPGGDPLRAALQAGELPSPEMIAAAGATQGISAGRAWLAFGLFFVGILAAIASSHIRSVSGHAPVSIAPEGLAERAREVLRAAGAEEGPTADRSYGFRLDREALDWLRANGPAPDPLAPLASLRIGTTAFWYRQAPKPLEPVNMRGVVTPSDPNPLAVSGSSVVLLDEAGRLISLLVVPPQVPGSGPDADAEPDWTPLFRTSGLDISSFARATPEWLPSSFADRRFAWSGTWPETPGIPLRIEAASFGGQPVWFEVLRPWSRPVRMQPAQESRSQRIAMNLNVALVIAGLIGAISLARVSLKSGRADARGARRVSFAIFAVTLLGWACTAHHQRNIQDEWGLFLQGTALALLLAGICCALYLGLEPVVRKRLPHALIGWNRLTAGRLRDPLVARDVLYGLAAAGALGLFQAGFGEALARFGVGRPMLALEDFDGTVGILAFIGQIAQLSVGVLISPMLILLLLSVLAGLLRSTTAAFVVALLLIGTVASGATVAMVGSAVFAIVAGFAAIGTMLFVLRRFGLLALMAMTLPNVVLSGFPATLDPSHWFFGYSAAAAAVLVAVGLVALRWADPARVRAA